MRFFQIKIALISILLSCSFISSYAQLIQVLPVDDALKDNSLSTFRDKLLIAAIEQDTTFVYSVVDSNVFNGFGGDRGIDCFKAYWRKWGLRIGIINALKLGGTLSDDRRVFSVPYIWEQFPEEYDSFANAVIIGSNVSVRKKPKLNSDKIIQVSYNIVKINDWSKLYDSDSGLNWIKVELDSGGTGYICDKYIRSHIDHRIFFEKRGNKWFLTSWAAGD